MTHDEIRIGSGCCVWLGVDTDMGVYLSVRLGVGRTRGRQNHGETGCPLSSNSCTNYYLHEL